MAKQEFEGVRRKSWGQGKPPTVAKGKVKKNRVGRPAKPKKPKLSRKNNYRTSYAPEMLDEAEKYYREQIEKKRANPLLKLSIRDVANDFGVPKSTLSDRLSGKSSSTLGRPTALSNEEEKYIVERLILLGTWSFPLSKLDLQFFVQAYLKLIGKNISRFPDNLPGPDWVSGFLKRHKKLTVRKACLIKRSRGDVDHEEVKAFFAHFLETARDIAPENMMNYDETNLRDNPGAKDAIFRRGVKHAEEVADHSKSSISAMFAGTAMGEAMAPFVVYKAKNLYPSWCVGGPKGTRYYVTPSGWFDMQAFREWFKTIVLPWAKRRPKEVKKCLIGDNLASHIDEWVIQQCKENNIEFICFPPNSTHLLQPLDVGVFGPMKAAWKRILRKYKKQDPSANAVSKVDFPRLLKELYDSLPFHKYLPVAFEACGLCPMDMERVLARIPDTSTSSDICTNLDAVLTETLKVKRFNKSANKKTRGKKIPPGKSYSSDDGDTTNEEEEQDSDDGETANEEEEQDPDQVRGQEEDDEDEETEVSGLVGEDDSDDDGEDRKGEKDDLQPGDIVAAVYEERWFVAEVMETEEKVRKEGYFKLSYWQIKGQNCFAFSESDILDTPREDIICKIKPNIVNTNRNYYGVCKNDLNIIGRFMGNLKK